MAGPALGQTVELTNGVVGDNALSINVDAYGSWASTGFGGDGDTYNPVGGGPPLAEKGVVFTDGFFLFSGGNKRELLSESSNWQGVFAADDSLEREITSPITVDGSTGIASSNFRVYDPAGTFDVSFRLSQKIGAPTGVAGGFEVRTAYGDVFQLGQTSTLFQTYVITNNAGGDSFQMVRAVDADILFAPGAAFNDDEVGTNTNALDPFGTNSVWQQDDVNPGVSRITTAGESFDANVQNGAYYGGLMGDLPGGVEPAFGYGTDVQVWDAYGVPKNWRNYVSNVGYNTDGESGPGVSQDGFHGIEFTIVPEPTSFALMTLLGVGLLARRRRLG
jgi:hypothetical protein